MTTLFDEPEATVNELPAVIEPLPPAQVTPLLLIERAMERGVDPGKLYELAQQWERDQAAERFAVALATFQSRCPQIKKNRSIDLGSGKGPQYASLDDIMREIGGLLAECGLSITFSAAVTESGMLTAKCLVHHGRHVEHSEITLPVPSNMRVNDTQKMGAALSYAKRYALCAALNIIVTDEDEDGGGLLETITDEQAATLREWIANTESNESAFFKYMGVKSLGQIAAADYGKALDALKRKAKR